MDIKKKLFLPSIQAHHISLRPCHLNFHSFQIGHHSRSLVTIKHDKNILIIVNPLTLAAVAFPINQNDWMPAKFLFFLSRTPRRRSLPMMFWGVKLQTLNFVFFSLSLACHSCRSLVFCHEIDIALKFIIEKLVTTCL